MPIPNDNDPSRNSEEVHQIITAVPKWIIRWGITLIFCLILLLVTLAAFIQYPDIVKTQLKVNSLNAPKGITAKQGGKLTHILVKENQTVQAGQALGYIESSGSHHDVAQLYIKLKELQKLTQSGQQLTAAHISTPLNLSLGELQSAYQNFYQEYLQYVSTQMDGFYQRKRTYLEKELKEITKLRDQINSQKDIQEQEYKNAEQEYEAYKKLIAKGVVSKIEFKQQESKYLASKYPLQQTATSLLNNTSSYSAKEKELLELDNTIREQQAKFQQSLNSILSEIQGWQIKYVLSSPLNGIVSYSGIIQENQNLNAGQEVFIINPGNTNYFGEVQIPQFNMGKIRTGQRTLVKLRSFPFEEFGVINGKVSYVSDVALKDSVFIARIQFGKVENKESGKNINLKNGMMADAEIITQESSLLQRFYRNITKMLNTRS